MEGQYPRRYRFQHAGVAELGDATGLGPVGLNGPWRFESSRPHLAQPDGGVFASGPGMPGPYSSDSGHVSRPHHLAADTMALR